MISPDVKNLQIFLNSFTPLETTGQPLSPAEQIAFPFRVADQGAGSKNNETSYFGPATYRAVIKFQEYYTKDILTPNNLAKGTGYFGPATMRKVHLLLGR